MNIKRIIREELDDFDWIRDIDPHEELYEPWVVRSIGMMSSTIYYFERNVSVVLDALKRNTREKEIIERAIIIIGREIKRLRIRKGRHEHEDDNNFLEGYELLKKSIQPKIYKRDIRRYEY
jgi:hypothetical protein